MNLIDLAQDRNRWRLVLRQRTSRLHKMRGISSPAEDLLRFSGRAVFSGVY